MTHEVAQRTQTTVVLAMSADGKIADVQRSPARFGSAADQQHLERQVAQADGVLVGAGTLRTYGTTIRVTTPELLGQRRAAGKPSQPVQIVCSGSAHLDPNLRFFRQPVPHWLLTTQAGAQSWQQPGFEQIIIAGQDRIDWPTALRNLGSLGLERVAVLGGGQLVASLLAAGLVDELWLTVCPLILGGSQSPTPVDGLGFAAQLAPRLHLLSVETQEQEVFLHYRLSN
jgi:5-amino-6-(5-phosphoribosylamino)uracil reductase